ncbi:MAG: MaoC family dehydratase N-terminal domain-containing protein [Deltaproteobacteria bacterium]|nr:MaoC family dehydratase N-terminal domain-containing protein [Deltaproteobacteria bacterium]MBW2305669.1 MaoC family dehydratase N-terminal domain-containing protein [Deltaproteobacteria bacterium]
MFEVDISVVGKEFPAQTFDVEKGRIYDFVNAIEDPNPIYRDENAALASGYPNIMVPPTYAIALRDERGDTQRALADMGFPMGHSLHGEQEFEYYRYLRPGQTYTTQSRIAHAADKDGRSGPIVLLTLITEILDSHGTLCVRARKVIVLRNARLRKP